MSPRVSASDAADRRGVVLPLMVVVMVILLGFASLTIDVGYLFKVKAEAQRAADAASLAAASLLGTGTAGNAVSLARQAAIEYAGLNMVAERPALLDPKTDIEFGTAEYDEDTGKFSFGPVNGRPTAVRVTVRKTHDSPNGPARLFFASILGRQVADVSARAAAKVKPRDIALVIDLTGSMNDDSELQHVHVTPINNWQVWANLPVPKGNSGVGNGIDPPPPGHPNNENDQPGSQPGSPANKGGNPDPGADPQMAGPAWGFLGTLGWGDVDLDPGAYDPRGDTGLAYLPSGRDWDSQTLREAMGYQGYSQQEIDTVMAWTGHHEDSRTAVALGLAVWSSGLGGGLWATRGLNPGDGDMRVAPAEISWAYEYPYAGGSWTDYFRYVRSGNTTMLAGDQAFRYRFGLKTFVDYLLVEQNSSTQTPELAQTPSQPTQAVKDAVAHMIDVISEAATPDWVSLEVYSRYGHHEVDLTDDYWAVPQRLDEMQAGHYEQVTNIGEGIQAGIAELTGPRARPEAIKVMVLLTDGNANVGADDVYRSDGRLGGQYAVAMAQAAAALGIRIDTVSVGAAADRSLMQTIAQIGSGREFFAGGPMETYAAQLQQIFATLGREYSAILIE